MRLSVIIVNYNVKYFLEQCLASVQHAIQGIDAEVIVVDNKSVDGSVEMVREKFPAVTCIANTENTGFSKANNQGMRLAKGEYILLLNPDTVVKEDTFKKVIAFMDAHEDAGGLGVLMVDGKGKMLPESKRGLPTPETSFYKIFGLGRIFPKSKRFNRYYLGHLSNNETHEIEILSGAFMFMRKAALDQVGLLDEAFFMYGEDIDLSWRIIQGGWKNYYFPETSIIHYKGESTKKGSLNYVYVFYNAMVIFAKKHFSASHATTFSFFIQLAIWMRASLSIVKRFIASASLPVIDSLVLFFGVKFFADTYGAWQMKNFEEHLVEVSAFAFALLTWFFNWLSGAYDRPLIPRRSLKPVLWVTLLTLLVYSLLPEQVRFSRMVVLMSAGLAFTIIPALHFVYRGITTRKWNWRSQTSKRILIAGSDEEAQRVEDFLKQIHYPVASFTRLKAVDTSALADLNEYVRIHRIHEVIFCGKDLSSSAIIGAMSRFSHLEVEYKIAPPERHFIIGSQQIQSANDTFFVEVNSIGTKLNKRQKRAFDLATSSALLLTFPLLFATKHPAKRLVNCLEVFVGKKSWIGYYGNETSTLPNIRSGVFPPNKNAAFLNEEGVQQMNALYAKDYSWWKDLRLLQQLFSL